MLDVLAGLSRVRFTIREDPDLLRPVDVPALVCNAANAAHAVWLGAGYPAGADDARFAQLLARAGRDGGRRTADGGRLTADGRLSRRWPYCLRCST